MEMLSHYKQRTTLLPYPPFWNSRNLKSVTLAAPVLTWGSPVLNQSPSLTYRQESGTGGIQEGLVWLWAIMEMTVCYEALGRPCQILTRPLPPPSPPTAFFTLPDWRRFRTKYSQDATAALVKQKRRTARVCSANQSATADSTNAPAAPLSF